MVGRQWRFRRGAKRSKTVPGGRTDGGKKVGNIRAGLKKGKRGGRLKLKVEDFLGDRGRFEQTTTESG